MKFTKDEIANTVKNYILKRFFRDSESHTLTNETPLISSGIIDSILTMQLVVFIEETYHFEFSPHEVDKDNLNTINTISDYIEKKLNG